jgi:hypothetical protein
LDIDIWHHLLFLRLLLAIAMLAALVLSAGLIAGYKAWRAIERGKDLRTHGGALRERGPVGTSALVGEIR